MNYASDDTDFEIAISVNGVPIRLTDERWENKKDMPDMMKNPMYSIYNFNVLPTFTSAKSETMELLSNTMMLTTL